MKKSIVNILTVILGLLVVQIVLFIFPGIPFLLGIPFYIKLVEIREILHKHYILEGSLTHTFIDVVTFGVGLAITLGFLYGFYYLLKYLYKMLWWRKHHKECPVCNGKGWQKSECNSCKGNGFAEL